MSQSQTQLDHDVIRKWAAQERRAARRGRIAEVTAALLLATLFILLVCWMYPAAARLFL